MGDGVGLREEARENEGGGLGLRSMRQRAEEIGAEIRWRPASGGGTSVVVVFPLRRGRPGPLFLIGHSSGSGVVTPGPGVTPSALRRVVTPGEVSTPP
ncbi:MAG: hypothetical protein ACE5JR_10990 [Gemmatimonadota bacterium]